MNRLALIGLALCLAGCSFELKTAVSSESDQSSPLDVNISADAILDGATGQDQSTSDQHEPGDIQLSDVGVSDAFGDILGSCDDNDDCDDGKQCTLDKCNYGVCVHLVDESVCPESNSCQTWVCGDDDQCIMVPLVGQPCVLDDLCSISAQCDSNGECASIESKFCKSTECMISSCNSDTGECDYVSDAGTECDDGNACTEDDKCLSGVCSGVFNDNACLCQSDEDCVPFDNGNMCDGVLGCIDGHCNVLVDTIVVCPVTTQAECHFFQCDPASGECVQGFKPGGSTCNDANACTQGDKCVGSLCMGDSLPDQSSCNLDNDLCTLDFCHAGECTAGPAKDCQSASACLASQCQPATGKCLPLQQSGLPCDDGDACTTGDLCIGGQCNPGTYTCTDCSADGMEGRPCSDDDPNTSGDLCIQKTCRGFARVLLPSGSGGSTFTGHVTSTPGMYHGLVVSAPTSSSSPVPGIMSFASGGEPSGFAASAAQVVLSDLSGRVAVGKPDAVYYHGMAWTGNSELRQAVGNVCPGIGIGERPVVTRQSGGSSQTAELLSAPEVVVVGFDVAVSEAQACVVAVCVRIAGQSWACNGLDLTDLGQPDPGAGSKVLVSAMALDTPASQCGPLDPLCDQLAVKMALAYSVAKPGSQSMYVVSGEFTAPGLFLGKQVFSETAAPGGTGLRSALDLSFIGPRLVCAGSGGLLWAYDLQTGELTTVMLPETVVLAGATLVGIAVVDDVAMVGLRSAGGGNTQNAGVVRSGLLAGPSDWLWTPSTWSQVSYVELVAWPSCPTCNSPLDASLGLTGMSAALQVPENDQLPRLCLAISRREGPETLGELYFLQQ